MTVAADPRVLRPPLEVLRSYPSHDYTLPGLLDSRRSERGAQPMLVQDGCTRSWNECAKASTALACALAARGIHPGDRVAIVARNCSGHVLLLLALARLGAVMVPINPEFGAAELKYALQLADVSAVFAGEDALDAVREALAQAALPAWLARVGNDAGATDLPSLEAMAAEATPQVLPPRPSADTACLMIFTSGTTGFPKGVMHSQRNLLLAGEANVERLRLQPHDRILVVLPLFHINALFYSLGGMLACGGALILQARFSASQFWQVAADEGATVVNIIEAMGNILKARDRSEFRPDHRLRVVYGVRQHAQEAFRRDFGVQHLFTGFGMTEIPGVTCNPWDEPAKPGTMGLLGRHPDPTQPWAQARVVDDEGRDLGPGEVGELWVRTPVAMLGYFRNPEETAAAFHEGWLKTGDLVRRDAQGWFFHVSRKKDVIRRRGENIAGAELDLAIGAHPDVYECAAIAVPAELGEDEILVAVVPRQGAILREQDIAQWCRARLAPYKVPRYVALVESLPHTPTHKVAKAVMRQDPSLRQRAVDLQAPAPR